MPSLNFGIVFMTLCISFYCIHSLSFAMVCQTLCVFLFQQVKFIIDTSLASRNK